MTFFNEEAIQVAQQKMSPCNRTAWEQVCSQVHTQWHETYRGKLLPNGQSLNPIEAKALHVFTFMQKHVQAVDKLVGNQDNQPFWYVQCMILLYPIIEMVGAARLPVTADTKTNNRIKAGALWLSDPENIADPSTIPDDINTSICEVMSARNYLLHGLRTPDKDRTHREAIYSYEIPHKWRTQMAGESKRVYWRQLCQDSGQTDGWLDRLAKSDILPFKIPGASYFEDGYLLPDVVQFINES